jgi:hypothetical protein
MIQVGDAKSSGAGNPMISRNGKQTICQYACFTDGTEAK